MSISAESKLEISKSILTETPEQTELFGYEFGKTLNPGDIVGLIGVLGAGKTCFAAGISRAIGAMETVASPTFVLIRQYNGRLPLYHFDLYRLNNTAELDAIGYRDYFYGDGITVVEWADKAPELFPDSAKFVRLTIKGKCRLIEAGRLVK